MTIKDLGALRLRCRAAFETCKALVAKPERLLTDRERQILEALDDAREALRAALGSEALTAGPFAKNRTRRVRRLVNRAH